MMIRINLRSALILAATALFVLLPVQESTAQEAFDHFSTGFVLDGAHTNVACEACHTGGVFETASPNCESCHSSNGVIQATRKPADHVVTTGACVDCHTTAAWQPVTFHGPHVR